MQSMKDSNKSRRVTDFYIINKQGGKGNVDKIFWKRIKILLKIVLPSWKTKEFAFLVILTGLLVIRTVMSIWLADVQG